MAHLQILGTNTGDSTPCVYVFTDHAAYLFNCGEGTQRVCMTHSIRLARLQGVFATDVSAKTIGGLPGMALTLSDVGLSKLRVFGPPTINQLLSGMNTFYRTGRIDMGCDVCDNTGLTEGQRCPHCSERPPQKTDKKSGRAQSDLRLIPVPCKYSNEFLHLDSNLKVSAALLESPTNPKQVISYIVQGHPTPGKYDEAKSQALGLKKHDRRKGELAAGRSVEMEVPNAAGQLEMRMVHPSEVVGEPVCGLAFAIVDCPTADFLPSLVNHASFQHFQTSAASTASSSSSSSAPSGSSAPSAGSSVMPAMRLLSNQTYLPERVVDVEALWRQVGRAKKLDVMVHMAPFEVVSQPEYRKWMDSFGPIKHVMLNGEQCRQEHVFTNYLQIHHKLRAVNSQVFPALYENTRKPEFKAEEVKSSQAATQGDSPMVIPGALLWKYIYFPQNRAKVDESSVLPPYKNNNNNNNENKESTNGPKRKRDEKDISKNSQKRNDVGSSYASTTTTTSPESISSYYSSSSSSSSPPPPRLSTSPLPLTHLPFSTPDLDALSSWEVAPCISFLGTGSAVPSKYRNVTGMYFHPGLSGSGGMLLDCGEGTFGQLTRLYGQPRVNQLIRELACVWISHMHADHHLGLVKFIEEYAERWDGVDKLLVIGPNNLSAWLRSVGEACANPAWSRCYTHVSCEELATNEEAAAYVMRKMGVTLRNVTVLHCMDAWGLIITHPKGYKVVYSGDTEYCPALVEAGQGATVLIHEATMGPFMEQQAAEKRHSTITDAVRAGKDMGAERIILTHFSQRYSKIPEVGSGSGENPASGWARSIYTFDLMEIPFKALQSLPSCQSGLRAIFQQTELLEEGQRGLEGE